MITSRTDAEDMTFKKAPTAAAESEEKPPSYPALQVKPLLWNARLAFWGNREGRAKDGAR